MFNFAVLLRFEHNGHNIKLGLIAGIRVLPVFKQKADLQESKGCFLFVVVLCVCVVYGAFIDVFLCSV